MDWKDWIGKRVFLRTKRDRFYSGKVLDIKEEPPQLIFIMLLDKFGNKMMFLSSEIVEIREEKDKL